MEDKVKPLVEQHKRDPQYIVSRLVMNWKDGKHFTRFDVPAEKAQVITIREGNAPLPHGHARFCPDRLRGAARLDDYTVYFDGTGPLNSGNGPRQGAEAAMIPGLANMNILNLAADAAVIYYFTATRTTPSLPPTFSGPLRGALPIRKTLAKGWGSFPLKLWETPGATARSR